MGYGIFPESIPLGNVMRSIPVRPAFREGRMPASNLKSDALLLLTAVIWGFAFVAQRLGMSYVGPFTYSATRFTLGVAVLLPFALTSWRKGYFSADVPPAAFKSYLWAGLPAGLALFGGVSFQQVGLVYTTAGKAGFITGLYVVLVPILGLLGRQRASAGTWAGAVLAVMGLYLLSVNENFNISRGDLLVLGGAVIWAVHVHIVGYVAPRCDPLVFATVQFAVCAALSWLWALWGEIIQWGGILQAAAPILYGGVLSVGIAYTLQVVAQRRAHPAHASILLSLETVFAAVGGWLVLSELLSLRQIVGCAVMLAAMLLSQLDILLQAQRLRLSSAADSDRL